jgi:DNA-binding NarL/FixJ family response regulator
MSSRILVADDHVGARRGIAELIRYSGEDWVVACEAHDGRSAIDTAIGCKPDLIILDVRMPDVDGMRAAREIRAVLPNVPILFYTLLATPALELAALSAGYQGVIAKPDSAALLAAMRKILPSKKGGGMMPPGSTAGPSSSSAGAR